MCSSDLESPANVEPSERYEQKRRDQEEEPLGREKSALAEADLEPDAAEEEDHGDERDEAENRGWLRHAPLESPVVHVNPPWVRPEKRIISVVGLRGEHELRSRAPGRHRSVLSS